MSSSIRPIAASVRAVARTRLVPQKAPIVLTSAAVSRAKSLLEQQPDAIGLKVGVKTRGCNGMAYTLEFASEKGKFDEEVIQDGVRVIIDSKALMTLLGTEMDFQSTKLAAEFVFHNPNIKGTCGCGESFNV